MKEIEKIAERMLEKQKICYLSSVDSEGFPNTKAMLRPRKRNGISELYFSTNTSSKKVQSFRNNPKACVYLCDTLFSKGIMLKGTIEVLEDQEHKNMLWKKGDTMYYPKGVTDPDYCVLKFTTISARYYHHFQSEDMEIR